MKHVNTKYKHYKRIAFFNPSVTLTYIFLKISDDSVYDKTKHHSLMAQIILK